MQVEKAAIIDLNEGKKLAPISHCHQRHQDEIAIRGIPIITIDDYAVSSLAMSLNLSILHRLVIILMKMTIVPEKSDILIRDGWRNIPIVRQVKATSQTES